MDPAENKEVQEQGQAPETAIATETAVPAPDAPSEAATQTLEIPFYKKHQTAIAGAIALVILLGAGYYVYTKNYYLGGTVATVNGKHIYKKEFDASVALIEQNATAQGIDLSQEETKTGIRNQALDVLINNALLISAAENAGFTVSDEDVNTKYDELVTQVGSKEELATRMAEIGLTEEKLRSNIRERMLADQYIESETDIESLTVSDDEVNAFIKTINVNGAELPPIEEIRPQIEAQILSQKQQQIVNDLLTKLKGSATIDIEI